MTPPAEHTPVDPFDLPEWLGEQEVTWAAESGLRSGPVVRGILTSPGSEVLACDLLAVDAAYPAPVASEQIRHRAHQVWSYGEVYLVAGVSTGSTTGVGAGEGRLTLAVPGTAFTADLVLDSVSRLARAVAASAERYSVLLRIGDAAR